MAPRHASLKPMNNLASTQGIVAIAACVIAIVALALAAALFLRLRKLQRAQAVVLGSESRDLVQHAATLDQTLDELRSLQQRSADDLNRRIEYNERLADTALSHFAVIRFDAYEQLGGRQSSAVALLDRQGSGVVVSSINQREHGRVYAKEIHNWQSELELLPEEQQAMEAAAEGSSADSE